MSFRLTTRERNEILKRLDEVCACSKAGEAVTYGLIEASQSEGPARYKQRPKARYKQGFICGASANYSPRWRSVAKIDGYLAYMMRDGFWEPIEPISPLILMADAARDPTPPASSEYPQDQDRDPLPSDD